MNKCGEPKIAFCLYGQPRYLDNPNIFMRYKELILDKYDCDVFAHMWWEYEGSDYEVSSWSDISSCPMQVDAPKILDEYYKPVLFEIDKPEKIVCSDDVEDYIRLKFVENDEFYQYTDLNFRNILSQLKSIQKVTKLLKAYSNKNSISYDFLILARYDTVIGDFPNITDLNPDIFYTPNSYLKNGLNYYSDIFQVMGIRYLNWANNLLKDIEFTFDSIEYMEPENFKYQSLIMRYDKNNLCFANFGKIAIFRGENLISWDMERIDETRMIGKKVLRN